MKNTWFTTVSLLLSLYSWGFLTHLWERINLEYLDLLVSNPSFLTGWSSLVASLTVTMTECSAPHLEKHTFFIVCWAGQRKMTKVDWWFHCDVSVRICALLEYTPVQIITTPICEITWFYTKNILFNTKNLFTVWLILLPGNSVNPWEILGNYSSERKWVSISIYNTNHITCSFI